MKDAADWERYYEYLPAWDLFEYCRQDFIRKNAANGWVNGYQWPPTENYVHRPESLLSARIGRVPEIFGTNELAHGAHVDISLNKTTSDKMTKGWG